VAARRQAYALCRRHRNVCPQLCFLGFPVYRSAHCQSSRVGSERLSAAERSEHLRSRKRVAGFLMLDLLADLPPSFWVALATLVIGAMWAREKISVGIGLPMLAWFRLRELIRGKCDKVEVEFEHASGEVTPETRSPLAEE
jgi:hypothetical protein